MLVFSIGIACIAGLLGFLVGASESPVAGIALTATFGIVATGLALHQRAASVFAPTHLPTIPRPEPTAIEVLRALKSLGALLVVFSIAFAAGLALGVWGKLQSHAVEPESKLFWQGLSAPTSARRAIDWLVVRKKLTDMGYTDAQVIELYRIDMERKNSDKDNSYLSADQLLSPILSEVPVASGPGRKGHLIAQDPRLKRRGWYDG